MCLSLNCDFCDLFDEDDEERKKHRRCVILIAMQNNKRMNSVGVFSSLRDFFRVRVFVSITITQLRCYLFFLEFYSLNCDFCDLFDEDDEERKKHRRCVIVIAMQNNKRMNSVGVIPSLRDFLRVSVFISITMT